MNRAYDQHMIERDIKTISADNPKWFGFGAWCGSWTVVNCFSYKSYGTHEREKKADKNAILQTTMRYRKCDHECRSFLLFNQRFNQICFASIVDFDLYYFIRSKEMNGIRPFFTIFPVLFFSNSFFFDSCTRTQLINKPMRSIFHRNNRCCF